MNSRILNQTGSISPVAFLIFFLILTFISVHTANNLLELKKLKFRNKSYLCSKTVINDLVSYYKNIELSNKAIITAYYLQFTPNPTIAASAKATHKTLISGQQLYHFSQLKNLGDKKYCSWKNTLNLVITPPVHMKRKRDGSMEFKKLWKNQIIFKASAPLNTLRDSLVIQITLRKTIDSFKMTSKEISKEVLSKSNLLAGFSL